MEEQGEFIMQGLLDGIASLIDSVGGKFGEIKDKIVDIWDKLKEKTSDIWDDIKDAIKTPINAIIGFINGMISGIVDGINSLIRLLNKFKIDIPDNPLTGAVSIGFNLSELL